MNRTCAFIWLSFNTWLHQHSVAKSNFAKYSVRELIKMNFIFVQTLPGFALYHNILSPSNPDEVQSLYYMRLIGIETWISWENVFYRCFTMDTGHVASCHRFIWNWFWLGDDMNVVNQIPLLTITEQWNHSHIWNEHPYRRLIWIQWFYDSSLNLS